MTKFRSLLLAGAALSLLPVTAQAQNQIGFDGTVTLGYSAGSIDVVDINTMSFGLQSEFTFTENFGLGFDFDIASSDFDVAGFGLDADLTRFQLEPTYYFGNGAYAGLYYQMAQIDLSSGAIVPALGLSIELNSYGVFGGYDAGPWYVEAYVGVSDTGPSLPSSVDITDYGISAGYEINPQFEVYGSYAMTDISGPGFGIDVSLLAIGAEYDFGNGFGVYGGAGLFQIDTGLGIDIEATQLALGATYDLAAAGSAVPAVLSIEYANTDIDLGGFSDNIDTFTVGVTFPIGGGSSSPLNAATRAARGDIRSAIVSGLGVAF